MTAERTLAGHRILRLLAPGERSRVWLAPDDLVLKELPAGVDAAPEIVALHRGRGDHVIELLDVSRDDECTVLVFPRLSRGSLTQLLTTRQGLDAGEAVTALAPIAGCLAGLHRAGVAHGDLTTESVMFRDDGAPMLIGFGGAVLFEAGLPEVGLETNYAVLADRRALTALVLTVLSRVSGSRAAAAAQLASRLRTVEPPLPGESMAAQLFELAAALPIRFAPDEAPAADRRVVGLSEYGEADESLQGSGPDRRGPLTAVLELAVVSRVLESGPARLLRESVSGVWQAWSPRRRRGTIAAAAIAGVLLIAVPAIPSASPPVADPANAATAEAAAADDDAGMSAPELPSEVTGDDPLTAVGVLLDRRTECFRELSALCFDEVDEAGSSALDADRAALDALLAQASQPTVLSGNGATLVERLGDSAIVTLEPGTQPASLLLLKGEAGWRIRDYIAGSEG